MHHNGIHPGKGLMFSLISGLTLSQGVFAAEKSSKEQRPNIIFIVADDMGYGDLACYGNDVVKTPNIDKLASEGVRFTQAYAGSAVSSPSRCCLLTGKNTGHSRIRDNFAKAGGILGDKNGKPIRRVHLLETDTTLALMLHPAGYHSMLINKWHQDGFNPEAGPLDRGFDEFKGWLISYPESNLPYYYPSHRFDNRNLVEVPANQNDIQGIHCNDLSTDEAIDFIQRNHKGPFFLYLAYDTPHEPYVIKDRGIYEKMDLSETAKTYAALISNMDANVGRLLKTIDNSGLKKNTVVLYISDNGGAVMAPHKELKCNANLRGLKGTLWEGGIRIPMIARWPGHFNARAVTDVPVYFPDIMPTVAAITGTNTPQGMDGINLYPLLQGKEIADDDRKLYWEFPGHAQAVRWGKWKFIKPVWSEPAQLYDLTSDISETTDLSAEHPEIIKEIERYIVSNRSESENWPLE